MLASEQGRAVTRKYLNVARSMREYEEQVFNLEFDSIAISSMVPFCRKYFSSEFKVPYFDDRNNSIKQTKRRN
jgi:hypothetical protein